MSTITDRHGLGGKLRFFFLAIERVKILTTDIIQYSYYISGQSKIQPEWVMELEKNRVEAEQKKLLGFVRGCYMLLQIKKFFGVFLFNVYVDIKGW